VSAGLWAINGTAEKQDIFILFFVMVYEIIIETFY